MKYTIFFLISIISMQSFTAEHSGKLTIENNLREKMVFLSYISYEGPTFEKNSGKIHLGPLRGYNNKNIITRYRLAKPTVTVQAIESDIVGATCSDIAFDVDVAQLLRVEEEGNMVNFYQNDKNIGKMQLYETSHYALAHRLQIVGSDDECCILQ